MHSGPVSLLGQGGSSHHRLPWPLGWQVGAPGTAPLGEFGFGLSSLGPCRPHVSELGPQAQLRGSPA